MNDYDTDTSDTYEDRIEQMGEKIMQLQAENKQFKNSMICLWCKKTMPKDTVKLTEHLLECKDHPLTRRIDALQAEHKQLKAFVNQWAGHKDTCSCLDDGSPRMDCTCGYDQAREQALKRNE